MPTRDYLPDHFSRQCMLAFSCTVLLQLWCGVEALYKAHEGRTSTGSGGLKNIGEGVDQWEAAKAAQTDQRGKPPDSAEYLLSL
jgi:hypothetical protein